MKLALLAFLLFADTPRPMTDEQIVADLRTEMDRLVSEDRFSGAVLLAKNGKPLFEQAYGYANHAFAARNTTDTKFNLASTAKMFTQVAILQLAQEGKLNLDDPIVKILSDYPNKEVAEKVTVRQLLDHRSGLGDFVNREFLATHPRLFRATRDYLKFFVNQKLLFEPGTQRAYSNAGYIVLGRIIEETAGESFENYVRVHIFEPAGMKNTGFWSFEDDVPNLAFGYTNQGVRIGGERMVTTTLSKGGGAAGATGPYSTLEDMLRFAEALRGNRLLNRDYTQKLLSGGYGMNSETTNGTRHAGHGGGTAGVNTWFELFPDSGYTLVALSNYDNGANLIEERVVAELSGEEVPHAVTLSAEALKQFEGTYAVGYPLDIKADAEGLWVNLDRGERRRFLPLSETEFFDRDTLSHTRLSFTKDDKGVATMTLKGTGPIRSVAGRKAR